MSNENNNGVMDFDGSSFIQNNETTSNQMPASSEVANTNTNVSNGTTTSDINVDDIFGTWNDASSTQEEVKPVSNDYNNSNINEQAKDNTVPLSVEDVFGNTDNNQISVSSDENKAALSIDGNLNNSETTASNVTDFSNKELESNNELTALALDAFTNMTSSEHLQENNGDVLQSVGSEVQPEIKETVGNDANNVVNPFEVNLGSNEPTNNGNSDSSIVNQSISPVNNGDTFQSSNSGIADFNAFMVKENNVNQNLDNNVYSSDGTSQANSLNTVTNQGENSIQDVNNVPSFEQNNDFNQPSLDNQFVVKESVSTENSENANNQNIQTTENTANLTDNGNLSVTNETFGSDAAPVLEPKTSMELNNQPTFNANINQESIPQAVNTPVEPVADINTVSNIENTNPVNNFSSNGSIAPAMNTDISNNSSNQAINLENNVAVNSNGNVLKEVNSNLLNNQNTNNGGTPLNPEPTLNTGNDVTLDNSINVGSIPNSNVNTPSVVDNNTTTGDSGKKNGKVSIPVVMLIIIVIVSIVVIVLRRNELMGFFQTLINK
ncbi:MAG: hypothetical protein SPK36_00725 [Bacilli bacterium]|nr:hypothetical protein [Bacilli bacterium]